jgi:hypothetical protein
MRYKNKRRASEIKRIIVNELREKFALSAERDLRQRRERLQNEHRERYERVYDQSYVIAYNAVFEALNKRLSGSDSDETIAAQSELSYEQTLSAIAERVLGEISGDDEVTAVACRHAVEEALQDASADAAAHVSESR